MQLNLWNEIIPLSDEWYTYPNTVRALEKYLSKKKIIWCPFDTKDSNFFKVLSESGYKVKVSHIKNGDDFFQTRQVKNMKILIYDKI